MVFNMATRYVLPQWNVVFDNSYKTGKHTDQLVIENEIIFLQEKQIVFRARYGRGYKGYAKVHSSMHPKPEPPPLEQLQQSQPSPVQCGYSLLPEVQTSSRTKTHIEMVSSFWFSCPGLKNQL